LRTLVRKKKNKGGKGPPGGITFCGIEKPVNRKRKRRYKNSWGEVEERSARTAEYSFKKKYSELENLLEGGGGVWGNAGGKRVPKKSARVHRERHDEDSNYQGQRRSAKKGKLRSGGKSKGGRKNLLGQK